MVCIPLWDTGDAWVVVYRRWVFGDTSNECAISHAYFLCVKCFVGDKATNTQNNEQKTIISHWCRCYNVYGKLLNGLLSWQFAKCEPQPDTSSAFASQFPSGQACKSNICV